MIKMKPQSWLLLVLLAIVAAFAAGVRQGVHVERRNIAKEQQLRLQLVTVIPSPTEPIEFKNIVDDECHVRYLLPSSFASGSGVISINCDKLDASASAKLEKQGYIGVSIASAGAKFKMWVKAPKNLEKLLFHTIQSDSTDE